MPVSTSLPTLLQRTQAFPDSISASPKTEQKWTCWFAGTTCYHKARIFQAMILKISLCPPKQNAFCNTVVRFSSLRGCVKLRVHLMYADTCALSDINLLQDADLPGMATSINILKVPRYATQHFLNLFTYFPPSYLTRTGKYRSKQTNKNTEHAATCGIVDVQ